VGLRLKREGRRISRVITSPFLRCVETSAELASALGNEKLVEIENEIIIPAVKPSISMIRAQNVHRHFKDISNVRKFYKTDFYACDIRSEFFVIKILFVPYYSILLLISISSEFYLYFATKTTN
jgi:hypothetical protein